MTDNQTVLVHGTCVALATRGALLQGPPGAGKSDLALRFITGHGIKDAALVADDQVRIKREGDILNASAPAVLEGMLEVRGIGIIAFKPLISVPLALVVTLCARGEVPRLPPSPLPRQEILGVLLPVLTLSPFDSSSPVKLKLALEKLIQA